MSVSSLKLVKDREEVPQKIREEFYDMLAVCARRMFSKTDDQRQINNLAASMKRKLTTEEQQQVFDYEVKNSQNIRTLLDELNTDEDKTTIDADEVVTRITSPSFYKTYDVLEEATKLLRDMIKLKVSSEASFGNMPSEK
ncbi:MAG: hypothetical protein V4691_06205 [Pseudomonadota bacterium]